MSNNWDKVVDEEGRKIMCRRTLESLLVLKRVQKGIQIYTSVSASIKYNDPAIFQLISISEANNESCFSNFQNTSILVMNLCNQNEK